jgi:spore coat polysaccharide biosynthesis protein SpsF
MRSTTNDIRGDEAAGLVQSCAGEFGDEYIIANFHIDGGRGLFWLPLLERMKPEAVLEIGCNTGENLQWIAQKVPPNRIVGVDANTEALRLLEENVPGVRAMHAPARALPLGDRSIDFVFTVDVLARQTEETLDRVMSEVVRVAKRWVFCAEYLDPKTKEPERRRHKGVLDRRDYGGLYQDLFPIELALVEEGSLNADQGFGGETWWLFERC